MLPSNSNCCSRYNISLYRLFQEKFFYFPLLPFQVILIYMQIILFFAKLFHALKLHPHPLQFNMKSRPECIPLYFINIAYPNTNIYCNLWDILSQSYYMIFSLFMRNDPGLPGTGHITQNHYLEFSQ